MSWQPRSAQPLRAPADEGEQGGDGWSGTEEPVGDGGGRGRAGRGWVVGDGGAGRRWWRTRASSGLTAASAADEEDGESKQGIDDGFVIGVASTPDLTRLPMDLLVYGGLVLGFLPGVLIYSVIPRSAFSSQSKALNRTDRTGDTSPSNFSRGTFFI